MAQASVERAFQLVVAASNFFILVSSVCWVLASGSSDGYYILPVLASLSWLAENWPFEAFKRRTRGEETHCLCCGCVGAACKLCIRIVSAFCRFDNWEDKYRVVELVLKGLLSRV